MTAKTYLQQIYIINQRVRRLQQLRNRIREEIYSVKATSVSPDPVRSSVSGDHMVRMIAKVDSIERDIASEMQRLIEKREVIRKQIEALPDERHRAVLYNRYVMCQKWEQIAGNMHMDLRYVYRIHGNALASFAEVHGI